MPQQSRYSDAEFERLMNDVIMVLEKHGASRDLSLMVLGNVISHIFEHQINIIRNSIPYLKKNGYLPAKIRH